MQNIEEKEEVKIEEGKGKQMQKKEETDDNNVTRLNYVFII